MLSTERHSPFGANAIAGWPLLEAHPHAVVMYDEASGGVLRANRAFLDLTGWRDADTPTLNVRDLLVHGVGDDAMAALCLRSGAEIPCMAIAWSAVDPEGTVGMVEIAVGARDDVREFDEREQQMLEAQAIAQLGRWSLDIATGLVRASPELLAIYDLDPSMVIGEARLFVDCLHPDDRSRAEEALAGAVLDGTPSDEVLRVVRRDGAVRWVRCRARLARRRPDLAGTLVGVCQDITEQTLAERDLERMAMHDHLTGLANRAAFLAVLQHAIDDATRSGGYGVLFIDLARFKAVNDSLGHAGGDRVLIEVAARLTRVVSGGATVARFGGDEFAILCRDAGSGLEAAAAATQAIDAICAPVVIDGRYVSTGASVGISLVLDASRDCETVLAEADAAMYAAKETGRNTYQLFDASAREQARFRHRRTEELRHALAKGELCIHYQPDIDLASGAMVGVEALVRWNHPALGLIGPNDFIRDAETSNVILELGVWVLRRACCEVLSLPVTWSGSPPRLAVNVSARQFCDPSLIDAVRTVLAETGLEPSRLCLEITETVLMEDVETAIEALLGLRLLGVQLAIDDFGTGYSSLSYLKKFPVQAVKIDRAFVAGLGIDPAADAIVSAVVNLSHALGLEVIAEGIEEEEQLVGATALHCDRAQGFFWSAALPIDELRDWIDLQQTANIEIGVVRLGELLADRAASVQAKTGRSVVLQIGPRVADMYGDSIAVRNIVDHLLANAVAFSEANTPVVVAATSDRHWVRVSVADYGIGMTRGEATRSFEQFWQANPKAAGGNRRGTGIGLYIVRSLIEAMGGHVGVKSAPGRGSTVTFALPRAARARTATRWRNTRVGEDSLIRESMRQIGVPDRRGT